jgi:hypothetical protein
MTTGVNVNAGGELGTIALYSEHFSIPPASALIGGASYGSLPGPMPPLGGIVVAGIIGVALGLSGPAGAVNEHSWPTIEITVAPAAHLAHDPVEGVDLKGAYEALRRQMVFEGVPFLDAAELEREIADRKGTRS